MVFLDNKTKIIIIIESSPILNDSVGSFKTH